MKTVAVGVLQPTVDQRYLSVRNINVTGKQIVVMGVTNWVVVGCINVILFVKYRDHEP